MKKYIYITTSFVAFHAWPLAPEEVAFLRNSHRHVFNVEIMWQVVHNDRDLEFFIQKRKVDAFLNEKWSGQELKCTSCETMAEELLRTFNAVSVVVDEDGENGAMVEADNV